MENLTGNADTPTPEEKPTGKEPPKLGADFDELKVDVVEENQSGFDPDLEGSIFNPDIHDTNPDGTPKFKIRKGISTGIFAKRRGSKKAGTNTHKPKSKMEPTVDPATNNVAFSPEVISALGAAAYFQTMAVALGKEFSEPIRQTFYDEDSGAQITFDEATMMQNSIKGILIKKGVKTASPESMLILTMLTGITMRANMEGSEVRSKLLRPYASTKTKIVSWFKTRKKRKQEKRESKENLSGEAND